MNSKLKDSHMDELFEGVFPLTSVEECYNFFEDLCTITNCVQWRSVFRLQRCLMMVRFTVISSKRLALARRPSAVSINA